MKKTLLLQVILLATLAVSSQTNNLKIVEGTNSIYDDDDRATTVAFDADSNIYVAGRGSSSIVFGKGQTNETALVNGIAFLAKYSKYGTLLWVNELGNKYNGLTPNEVKITKGGNIYLVGFFSNEAKIYGTDVSLTGEAFTAFIIKYNSAGQYIWSTTIGGPQQDFGSNVLIDKDENIYFAGTFEDTVILGKGQPNEKKLISNGQADIFITKFSKDGEFLWGTEIGSETIDYSVGLVQIDDNSFYHIGDYSGTLRVGDYDSPDTTFTDYQYGGLTRFNSDGSWVFTRKCGTDILSTTVLNKNILITGRFNRNMNFYSRESYIPLINNSSNNNSNIYVASFDADGYANWVKGIYSDGYEQGLNLAADKKNHFYLTATFDDTITLGKDERNETTLYPVGGEGFVVANFFLGCFTEQGKFIWANQVYGTGGFPYDLKSDDDGRTYMVGTVKDTTIIRSGENQLDTLVGTGKSDILITRFNPYYNCPPDFSVNGNSNIDEDFQDTLTYSFALNKVPAKEINQKVSYKLDSVSGELVNYSFDTTGILKISSKLNLNGNQDFYFSADDGAAENYLAKNQFTLNINPVNDKPVIKGLVNPLSVDEDNPLDIKLTDLVVEDPDNVFPDDFSMQLEAMENYTLEGLKLVPELNFNGTVQVSSTVSDSIDNSESYIFDITINSVNDIPVITSVTDTLTTPENTTKKLSLDYFTVEDPDNTFPADFGLVVLDGENYSHQDTAITPATDFIGELNVNVKVNDGLDDSEDTTIRIEVKSVVGIKNNYSGYFSIYPNPFSSKIVFNFMDDKSSGEISIFNITGEKVFQTLITHQNKLILNLAEFESGIYYIQYQNGNHVVTKKVIKK